MRSHMTRRGVGHPALRALLLGLAAWAVGAPEARAQISYVETYKTAQYAQTGNGNSLSLSGYYSAANLYSVNPNAYTSASLTYPGPGSPLSLSAVSPTEFSYTSPFFASKAAIDAAFPMGTYTFSASNGGPATTTALSYTSDDYAQTLPWLTGTDYTALQGMNPNAAFTFHFSPFTTGTQAAASYIFLTVTDLTTNTLVVNDSFLSPSTTSQTVAANTFKAGDQYQYQLIFSNRDFGTVVPPGATFPPELGFDFRTTGTFTPAAVPEPASLALLAQALAVPALIAVVRRARRGR